MRLKAFESKMRKYSYDLNKVKIKTHRERHKKTDRNELLSWNSGGDFAEEPSPREERI